MPVIPPVPTVLLIPNEPLSDSRCLVRLYVWQGDEGRSFRLACELRESACIRQPRLFQGAGIAFVTGAAVCARPWRKRLGVDRGERPSVVTVNCRECDAEEVKEFLIGTARGFGASTV